MNEFVDRIESSVSGARIDETFSAEEIEQFRQELAIPDMRPAVSDVTINAWMYRMGCWGDVKIKHKDPENHFKGEISKEKFLKLLSDVNLIRAFGKWDIKDTDINKVTIYRDYIGIDGRQYREEFLIEIEFIEELKKAVKPKGFWGWF